MKVARITTLLEPQGRVDGQPIALKENKNIAFQGCIVLGKGFVISKEQAAEWIEADSKNKEVLFPYLNGEDLNSRPDCSASRFTIDFGEMPEKQALSYAAPFKHLKKFVYPERMKQDAGKYPRMVNEWWKYWNARPALREAISKLKEVLVLTRVSRTLVPVRIKTGSVMSDAVVVLLRTHMLIRRCYRLRCINTGQSRVVRECAEIRGTRLQTCLRRSQGLRILMRLQQSARLWMRNAVRL